MPESSNGCQRKPDITVDVFIGCASFSGLCMGIKLLEADFFLQKRLFVTSPALCENNNDEDP